MKKWLSHALKAVLIGGALFYIFQSFDISRITLLDIHPVLLFVSIAVLMGSYYIMAWRWYVLLDGVDAGSCVKSTFLCIAVNNLTPARLGEIAKIYFLKRNNGIPFSNLLPMLVLERTFDVAMVVIICLLGYFLHQDIMFDRSVIGVLILFLALFVIASMLFLAKIKKIIKLLSKSRYKKITGFIKGVLKTFVRTKPMIITKSFLLSFLLWGGNFLFTYTILLSVGNIELAVADALFVFMIVMLASLIPSLPANFGLIEAAFVFSLSHLGYSKELGLIVGLYFHFVQILFPTVYGIVIAVNRNMYKDLFRLKKGM